MDFGLKIKIQILYNKFRPKIWIDYCVHFLFENLKIVTDGWEAIQFIYFLVGGWLIYTLLENEWKS